MFFATRMIFFRLTSLVSTHHRNSHRTFNFFSLLIRATSRVAIYTNVTKFNMFYKIMFTTLVQDEVSFQLYQGGCNLLDASAPQHLNCFKSLRGGNRGWCGRGQQLVLLFAP